MHGVERSMRQLTGRDVSNGTAVIVEGAGWVLLLSATSLPYRWLGGVLIVAGIVTWGWPELRTSIAALRERDARHHGSPSGKSEAVEQGDEADEAFGGTRTR
jgi:hypothetical protein